MMNDTNKNKLDIVALGELLIDFTCVATDAAGYPTMAAHPGGAPANFLAMAAKLGAETALLGKVGDDAFGRLLTDTLRQANIGTEGLITAQDVFTTLAFVTLDTAGDRSFSFARKPGADTCLRPEELRLDLIDAARVFHFGSLSLTDEPARSATRRSVEYARSRGKLLTYDPNLRKPLWCDLNMAREQLLWGLEQADVVKLSDEEVEFLFGLDPEAGAQHILDNFNVQLVFVTCGAAGCHARSRRAAVRTDALQDICVVDTTGAGDIFGGAAVWQLLQLDTAPADLDEPQLRQITRFACTAAGLSTTRPGGISSVPSMEEIQAYL